MNSMAFCVLILCNFEKAGSFRRICHLHLAAYVCSFLLGLLFEADDVGEVVLQNIRISLNNSELKSSADFMNCNHCHV
jgi:hypothetical protein